MILAVLMLACTCQSERKSPVPSVDRESVKKSTCYVADDGSVLELELSAARDVQGSLTRPGAEKRMLAGRRSGRELKFDGVTVQLLGKSITLEDGEEKLMLELGACDGTPAPKPSAPAPEEGDKPE